MSGAFDDARALLRGPDLFPRWVAAERPLVLRDAGVDPDEELVVAERGDERLAFYVLDLGFPHGAEFLLDGVLRYVSW